MRLRWPRCSSQAHEGLLSDLSTTGDLEGTTAAWYAATELLDHVGPAGALYQVAT